ncbi:hypothetical protein Pelo_15788 [Pelomyxa schiedti]|nr:hypothetical protein Pelo_15788 [Pelomyxa schiedti]
MRPTKSRTRTTLHAHDAAAALIAALCWLSSLCHCGIPAPLTLSMSVLPSATGGFLVPHAMASSMSPQSLSQLDDQVTSGRALARSLGWCCGDGDGDAEMDAAAWGGYGNISCLGGDGDSLNVDGSNRLVPRIIHQINIKKAAGDPYIPENFLAYTQAWKDLNPDYVYLLWDGENLEEMVYRLYPELYNLYLAIDANVMRADAARLMLLYAYGGIYADLDYELLMPADSFLPVLKGNNSYQPSFGAAKSAPITNFLMVAATRSPFVGLMLSDLENSFYTNRNSYSYHDRVLDTFGTGFTSRHALAHPNAYCTFPAELFNPIDFCGVHTGNTNPSGIHHYALTWGDLSCSLNFLFRCHAKEAEVAAKVTTSGLVVSSFFAVAATVWYLRNRKQVGITAKSLSQLSIAARCTLIAVAYSSLSLTMGLLNRLFLLPFFEKSVPQMYFLYLAFCQLITTVAFFSVFFVTKAVEFQIERSTLIECVPCSLAFIGMIVTSFMSLKFLPSTTIFLWKSGSSMLTALGDWLLFGRVMSVHMFASFLLMMTSCFFFTMGSTGSSDSKNLVWIAVNTMCTSIYVLSFSRILTKSSSCWSSVFIINLISASMLMVFLTCFGSLLNSIDSTLTGHTLLRLCFVANCTFSFLLCVCTVYFLRETSPTTLCMVGQFNKVAVNLVTGTGLTSFGGFMGFLTGLAGSLLFVGGKLNNQHFQKKEPSKPNKAPQLL